jgi:hypothetical protein
LPRQRRKREKTGGRNFEPGQNSHTGDVFQRDREHIPRGSGTLMLRCVFHDRAEGIYKALCRVAEKDTTVLAFMHEYIDHTEGKPTKKIEKTQPLLHHGRRRQHDAVTPPRQPVGSGATLAPAPTALDRFILDGLAPVKVTP